MAFRDRKKANVQQELNMIPFVNFMVSIIPVLIVSVEFSKISVIDLKLPEGRGSQTTNKVANPPEVDESNKLLLTAIITDSVVTLGAKNGFLPTIFYQEFHHYIAKDDQTDFTVRYNPSQKDPPKHPKSGRPMLVYERYDIWLYACDETFLNIKKAFYTQYNEMLTDENGEPVQEVKPGQTVYALNNPRRVITVSNPADFQLRNMSTYDELKNRLMKVKERFGDAEDANDIIIAAENEVLYDKIIQLMDVARAANYPNISIAKLRG